MVADGLNAGLSSLTEKVNFTQDKVIRVAFVIFLICGITMGAAALIVNYPVITSGFFSVLTVVGTVCLIGMAWRGIGICLKNRKQAEADRLSL